jgi:hypothetical protein
MLDRSSQKAPARGLLLFRRRRGFVHLMVDS